MSSLSSSSSSAINVTSNCLPHHTSDSKVCSQEALLPASSFRSFLSFHVCFLCFFSFRPTSTSASRGRMKTGFSSPTAIRSAPRSETNEMQSPWCSCVVADKFVSIELRVAGMKRESLRNGLKLHPEGVLGWKTVRVRNALV
jgi:hypothetical protein